MWWSHETCCSDTTIGNERKIDKLLNHIYKKMILYVFSFFFRFTKFIWMREDT